jgi:hypothetical protein
MKGSLSMDGLARPAFVLLATVMVASLSADDGVVDASIERDIEGYWELDSTGKLPPAKRVNALASTIQRKTGIAPPAWWQQHILATLNSQRSSASPRVKRNASIVQRGNPPNHEHVIVMKDGREFKIDPLDGNWQRWNTEFANVYKHKENVYVLNAGGCLSPYPIYKVSTKDGTTIWRTMISGLPSVDLAGGAARHTTGLSIRDNSLVVFGIPNCGGAYAFAVNDSTGKVEWQFYLDVHGNRGAPIFGDPP